MNFYIKINFLSNRKKNSCHDKYSVQYKYHFVHNIIIRDKISRHLSLSLSLLYDERIYFIYKNSSSDSVVRVCNDLLLHV